MKKKSDPRHLARISTVKGLFAANFAGGKFRKTPFLNRTLSKQKKIDKLISLNAPTWPIEQIAPMDLAILRLAIYELLFNPKKEPFKVIVDEAVEIAKEYGSSSSPSFINGVLGSIIKSQGRK